MRQPPKGEKRHLRAELSLKRRIYDTGVLKLIPAVLDARLAPRITVGKDFLCNYLAGRASHGRSRPMADSVLLKLAIQSGFADAKRTRSHEFVAIELT